MYKKNIFPLRFNSDKEFRSVTALNGGDTIKRLLDSCKEDSKGQHGAIVAICNAGDTMVLKAGTQHAVLTVYPEGTSLADQVALVAGETYVQRCDIGDSVRLYYHRNGNAILNGEFCKELDLRLLPAYRNLYPELRTRVGNTYDLLKELACEKGLYNVVKSKAGSTKRLGRGHTMAQNRLKKKK